MAFIEACAPPALVALLIVFATVRLVWHTHFTIPAADQPNVAWRDQARLDRWQTVKGSVAVAAVVAIFLSPVESGLGTLCVAAVLLLSRRLASRDMLSAIDWHLLLLFAGLFVVTAAMTATGLTATTLEALDHLVGDPTALPVLAPALLLLSNLVGNVPAVILLLELLPGLNPDTRHAIAVLSTFAGNFLLVGSLANLIVAERAAQYGVRVGFASFAYAGIPITLSSMAIAVFWFA